MHFFSIDVETTGTNPFNPAHQLATVGAVAVDERGIISGNWYARLHYEDSWDADTHSWWLQQNKVAKNEMFSTEGRLFPSVAAREFVDWVRSISNNPVFVANPSTFDHAWVQRWLTAAHIDMPFSHRTMCLRSADWGRNGGEWGGKRTGNQSLIPHHALHDAQAQALDLLEMLK